MFENHADEVRPDASPCEVEAAARELLKIADDRAFETELAILSQRFAGHLAVFAARVRRLIKNKEYDEAAAMIDSHDFGDPAEWRAYMLKAELLFDAHQHDRSGELYLSLMDSPPPQRREVGMKYAKRLFTDGRLAQALEVLEPIRHYFGDGGQGQAILLKFDTLYALLSRLEGRPLERDENCRILAMKHAILHFRNRSLAPRVDSGLGRLSLITGGLGPGGAERQLTRLAVELEGARKRNGEVGGILLDSPLEVLVRSHGPEKQNDFYLADVQAAGIELHQINEFAVIPPTDFGVEDPELLQLLQYLPPNVNFGLQRLVPHFTASGTTTASAWQDGACLFTGLAALVAGVPQVQLAIRGLPPSVRRHMFRPEYEVFYRAMAQVPGVTFVSNSMSAARAYAEWLDIPVNRLEIVYNGVEQMSPDPSSDCEERWAQFVESTPQATHTVGGVFRFDTDKQPLLWIRFAARYLKRHPDSRMLLVGGGRLFDNAVKLAEDYGIQDRILFVGRSTRVGFWMTKMDVLVLLSRFEGLPNVLIEAQYMGVRVVTTPAGGASECVIDGTTGHVLGCAEQPDYMEIVEYTHKLAMRSQDRGLFEPGGVARNFLDTHFSVPHMLTQYVRCTSNGLGTADLEETMLPRPKRAASA